MLPCRNCYKAVLTNARFIVFVLGRYCSNTTMAGAESVSTALMVLILCNNILLSHWQYGFLLVLSSTITYLILTTSISIPHSITVPELEQVPGMT